jgi:hypothetical protein
MADKKITEILDDATLTSYEIDKHRVKDLTISDINNLSQALMETVRKRGPSGGGCQMCCCAMCCCAAAVKV